MRVITTEMPTKPSAQNGPTPTPAPSNTAIRQGAVGTRTPGVA
jgi:hypothetical protein